MKMTGAKAIVESLKEKELTLFLVFRVVKSFLFLMHFMMHLSVLS